MAELPEKEQLVLVLYYYEELTLKEIGEILDVTESRVCQIHTKAILRLKGKIQRHEGKTSIGQITREIQTENDRKTSDQPVGSINPATEKEFDPVNVMAALTLCQLTAYLALAGEWWRRLAGSHRLMP
jgi:predicted DNA-binding protein YlxM (UPF0122 family)